MTALPQPVLPLRPVPAHPGGPPDASLPEGEGLLHTLLASVAEGVVVCDPELRCRVWNRVMEEWTGIPEAEALGRTVAELFPQLRRFGIDQLLLRAMGGETVRSPDIPFRLRRTGKSGLAAGRYAPLLAPGGEVLGVLATIRDVTDRRRVEEENLRLAAFPRDIPNPVLECDAAGRIAYANPAAERAAGEAGVPVEGLLPHNSPQLARSALETGRGFRSVEVALRGRILAWTYHPHPALGVVHLFAEDVTGRRAVEEQLRHEALHDPLTGLPNRHLFLEHLARALLRAREHPEYPFAVLFLDLDRFKLINDSLGHHVGDRLLCVVAARLRGALRAEDTVARFGGDEFALLLADIAGPDVAVETAARIQAAISAPVNLDGYEVYTSASVGIALSSADYGRPEHLLRNADVAMYRAKAAGNGRYEMFDRAMHAHALLRLQQETELRHALDRGEMRLVYQPIVALATGRIEGFEALLRWVHPERGTVPAGDFVPLAEETGMILPIGRWVLEDACRRLREWQDAFPGRAPALSVNLSVRQFDQPDLAEQVEGALRASGADPAGLRLEITESVLAQSPDLAAATLMRFRALGIGVHMDDFGTGYSSLALLHHLPLDVLKIDRSFVRRIGGEGDALPVVRTIVALAGSLGLATVAEGVETPEQLRAVRELGCGSAQGYLFSRPVEADAARALLEAAPRW
ncbi:MAG TPA: EAL domain-containing protein [Longimicrobiaceae bacterium]|nr:EAL domain-containing protein [Longimicrobiaceae bacterium]